MDILLDTNAFLWMVANSKRIDSVRKLICDGSNSVFVSVVSWWEIAIKIRIGKLPEDFAVLRRASDESGCLELPLFARHAEALESLPIHHKDPFDHMILAQAMAENMLVVTGDRIFEQYTRLAVII